MLETIGAFLGGVGAVMVWRAIADGDRDNFMIIIGIIMFCVGFFILNNYVDYSGRLFI